MPRQRSVEAAVRITSLIATAVTSSRCHDTMSTTEPLGTGTLIEEPVSLPASPGSSSITTSAALVSWGMMFSAAARPRRGSSAGTSASRCWLV
jgi:hypothetical protein